MYNDCINVCLACDDNYSKHAGVVIASILANAKEEDKLNFYILESDVSESQKKHILDLKHLKSCEINFIKIDDTLFDDYKSIKTHNYISLPAYYRLKIASLLPNINRVLYLDCDVIVKDSLAELFFVDMNEKTLAGVKDINKRITKKNPTYVNSGVLLMNLEKIREVDLEKNLLDYTINNFENITTGDQEIINEVCKGDIKILDAAWNVQSSNFTNRSSYTNQPKIIHFVSKLKPWHFGSFSYHKMEYFKYLQLTPWALTEDEKDYWYKKNQFVSLIAYLKYRPLFMLRPRFYKALYYTYFSQIFENVFSIKDYEGTHRILRVLGLKIKFPKQEFARKKKENLYYYYKNNNIDITTLPPAEGQIRDIQLANLVLLKELDYVCKKNKLTYWLEYGTLIGAMRHKGYIPWDDDIDTGMLRVDYERIVEIFNRDTRNPDLFAGFVRFKQNPCQGVIKIQHKKCPYLFVDIFPYDYYGKKLTPTEQIYETKEILKSWNKAQKKASYEMTSTEVLSIMQEVRSELLTNNCSDSDLMWGLDSYHDQKSWLFSNDMMFPLQTIKYEGLDCPCINKPDEYLRKIFGDYMKYPKKIGFGHASYARLTSNEKDIIKNLVRSLEHVN